MVAMWFRRDLRLKDNAALCAAAASGERVLPLFIFDTEILSELPPDDARVSFFCQLLENMQGDLRGQGGSLAGFHDTPARAFNKLLADNAITAVYANADYEPYAIARDAEIARLLKSRGIAFHLLRDHLVFEPGEILKPDGTPYVVFTPFSKKWKSELTENRTSSHGKPTVKWSRHSYKLPTITEIGFKPSEIRVPDADISAKLIAGYANSRDFPSQRTSRLGPHLRFGSVSARQAVTEALKSGEGTFLNELIWREFFAHVLFHYPKTVSESFRPQYDNIKWRNDQAEFELWKTGRTGYPLVDAGMRELNATGFMHNRVRMVAASFLCKHLLIDWRWGEAYFALKLLDYEQASNVGNWQWAAGSGTDAAPYFRIFNPSEQARKFDGSGKYIVEWVPEYGTPAYPRPMVDHAMARERCLEAYKKAVG